LHNSPVIYVLNVVTQNETSKKLQNYTAKQSSNVITLTNTNTLFWKGYLKFIGLARFKFNTFHYEALGRLFLFAVEAGCVFEDKG